MKFVLRDFVVEAIITEPFRTQIIAHIKAESLQAAVKRMNEEYPKALLTSAREVEY